MIWIFVVIQALLDVVLLALVGIIIDQLRSRGGFDER